MTSNHHNKQVESLLVTPLAPGGNTESSGKVSEGHACACQCVCTAPWDRVPAGHTAGTGREHGELRQSAWYRAWYRACDYVCTTHSDTLGQGATQPGGPQQRRETLDNQSAAESVRLFQLCLHQLLLQVWTCAADGTVYFWPDDSASGHFDTAKGRSISVPGNKRERKGGGGRRLYPGPAWQTQLHIHTVWGDAGGLGGRGGASVFPAANVSA